MVMAGSFSRFVRMDQPITPRCCNAVMSACESWRSRFKTPTVCAPMATGPGVGFCGGKCPKRGITLVICNVP